jgi:hypothetical protein
VTTEPQAAARAPAALKRLIAAMVRHIVGAAAIAEPHLRLVCCGRTGLPGAISPAAGVVNNASSDGANVARLPPPGQGGSGGVPGAARPCPPQPAR